jgi:hypothetical protein
MYKIIKDIDTDSVNCIKRLTDNVYIPLSEGNTHYQEYLEWLSEGNIPITEEDSEQGTE